MRDADEPASTCDNATVLNEIRLIIIINQIRWTM